MENSKINKPADPVSTIIKNGKPHGQEQQSVAKSQPKSKQEK